MGTASSWRAAVWFAVAPAGRIGHRRPHAYRSRGRRRGSLSGRAGAGRGRRAASSTQLGGVEVASYQHANGAEINWTQVAAASYKFAFINRRQLLRQPHYASDLAQAKAAGLYLIGFVFTIPTSAVPSSRPTMPWQRLCRGMGLSCSGPGLPCRVRHPGPGGVPGRARAGVRVLRLRRGARPGPV